MALTEILGSERDRELLMHGRAADFLHGYVATETDGGWVRPLRFLPRQVRVLESCMAWHPGLFRQMARTTAGVCLRMRTDATEVALSLRLDPVSRWVRSRLRAIEGHEPTAPHDGVSCDVDGRHLACVRPEPMEGDLPGMPGLAGASVVSFCLEEPGEAPEEGLQVLPGLGRMREVTLWLPCLVGCRVRDVWCNGMTLEPIARAGELLVLGDDAAQGLFAGDPGLTWPALLSRRLGLDLLDQGLAGQVFQQGTATPLATRQAPSRIVVAYGSNYRHEPCSGTRTQREAASFLAEVAHIWPEVPCQVMTPLWHDERRYASHPRSCFSEVPYLICRAAAPHASMSVADGLTLMDDEPTLLSDADRPNARGAAEVAMRSFATMAIAETPRASLAGRAERLLENAPMRAFPIRECLRRGIGEVLFAREGCVVLRVPDGNQYVFAPDHELGRAVVALLLEPTLVTVLEPGFERDVREVLGLDLVEPYHLVVYEGAGRLKVSRKKAAAIRPLDVSFAETVYANYDFPQFVGPEEVRRRLEAGTILGGFEGDELVGFVGEHQEGSIGMLEVLPGHRGKGWGEALAATKANEMLGRGFTPWTEVYPYNKASLKMHEKLGFAVYPATDQCFVSRDIGRD